MSRKSAKAAERPPAFMYRKAEEETRRQVEGPVLFCDDVPLPRLASKFGTPLYVYSASAIASRLAAFHRAFHKIPHTICYSIKANSNLGVLRLVDKRGCGFDVVSGGELERVFKINPRALKGVVFSGVGKRREEMMAALKADILLFNVESESELDLLAECAAKLKKTAPIALRVNPDVPAKTHPYISTGLHQHKFGIPIAQARALYARVQQMPSLRVRGVSVHIGSQITQLKPFTAAMERVAALAKSLRQDGQQIDYVDAGGGLGIAYEKAGLPEFSKYVAAYARAVLAPLRGLGVHLLLEPGRSIVGPAGVLLTSVLYRKSNDGKRFLVVDAAMNDLLRPALYGAYHEIVPVVTPAVSSPAYETVDIVGPVCESGDFLARDREFPVVAEGSLLAVLDVGAYGMSLASNYNSRARPAEVLVSGRSVKLVRRRESHADLMRQELL